MKNHEYFEDDGRTIVDMSDVSRQPLIFPRPMRRKPPKAENIPTQETPSEPLELSKEELRWAVLGAMKAGLLIALAFIVGLGIVILLFVL